MRHKAGLTSKCPAIQLGGRGASDDVAIAIALGEGISSKWKRRENWDADGQNLTPSSGHFTRPKVRLLDGSLKRQLYLICITSCSLLLPSWSSFPINSSVSF